MRKLYKLISTLFPALLVILATFGTANAEFSDVQNTSTFYDAIAGLEEDGVINGYPDGTFKPENEINRAEFLKIVMEAKYDNITGISCFTDVTNQWFARFVCKAKSLNIVSGYVDGTFKPETTITFAEALKITLHGYGVETEPAAVNQAWYVPYMEKGSEEELFENLTVVPDRKINRGEAAQLIYNVSSANLESSNDSGGSGGGSGSGGGGGGGGSGGSGDGGGGGGSGGGTGGTGTTNTTALYSWDGSFKPTASDFPLAGLFDEEYSNLPPGNWDWNNEANDYANYNNFEEKIGKFVALKDLQERQYGWRLAPNNPTAQDYAAAGSYFHGSSGMDIINLGVEGVIHSFGSGNLGEGTDILVFDKSNSLDFRTGSSLSGSKRDNDLVIGGCSPIVGTGFDIRTTTIHTGPGKDLVYVRDMERSAIDAGNGEGGKTSAIDPADGDDMVIFKGNMYDFRFFGGNGNDTAVWYVDEINQSTNLLGPNFFGGGGSDDALWGDDGTDTLVMVIPTSTEIIENGPTQEGQLMVKVHKDYPTTIDWDEPVYNDLYARYCVTCGLGPNDEKTVILEYRKVGGKVFTGYFYLTDIERLQIGLGSTAKVYDIDEVNGKVTLNETAAKKNVPTKNYPGQYCSGQILNSIPKINTEPLPSLTPRPQIFLK